jgi:hypothetical protein
VKKSEIKGQTENFMTNFIRIYSLFFLSFLIFTASAQVPEKQDAKPKYEKVSSHVILITVSGLGAEIKDRGH